MNISDMRILARDSHIAFFGLLPLFVSVSDEIQSIRTDEDFMYIPEFMDDDTTDEEFEEIPEYRKGYPCDGWSRTTDKDTFCLIVNKCPKFDVELHLSKYAASNYEVGADWGNIFEYANELLAKFIEHESLKTIKDLKDYLGKTGNKIFLKE